MFKVFLLRIIRGLGVFRLLKPLNRNKLLILCYHAYELRDESQAFPKLFIKADTFQKRLNTLQKAGYTVLPLSTGVDLLKRNQLHGYNAVITIDDGFHSVADVGIPILNQFNMPATIYLTTYYQQKQTPIFSLAVQYMFWQAEDRTPSLSELEPFSQQLSHAAHFDRQQLMWALIELGEDHLSQQEREQLAQKIATSLAIDYEAIRQDKLFTVMSSQQVQSCFSPNIDIQLHTHRHQLPVDQQLTTREILENRYALEQLLPKTYDHFCYPSGFWHKQHWPWLRAASVQSATTCEAGLNRPDTPLMALKRILDGEYISQVEFEAELYGFGELYRYFKRFVIKIKQTIEHARHTLNAQYAKRAK
ncbi:polysaccharide deacetylase family protein [Zooshikella marina]|uniref:polysaccharide deacetylase family protein n=1 Tax=Zooshikella ganghwensis TaxID=202772 RepID=UPI001BAEB5BE|nr:polysaccharide deacetylase family protein [Zooshikella ganghwensis]MBU2704431.1 polysaccharide deacetylase family protein [Zooshikella ganghwensis]